MTRAIMLTAIIATSLVAWSAQHSSAQTPETTVSADPASVESTTPLIFERDSRYQGIGPSGPYFPEKALRTNVGGFALLSCTADAKGNRHQCKVQTESPTGYAFGIASLTMARDGWMKAAQGPDAHVLARVEFPPSGGFKSR